MLVEFRNDQISLWKDDVFDVGMRPRRRLGISDIILLDWIINVIDVSTMQAKLLFVKLVFGVQVHVDEGGRFLKPICLPAHVNTLVHIDMPIFVFRNQLVRKHLTDRRIFVE